MNIDIFNIKSFPLLHESEFFPNMKELEESYACHDVFRKLKNEHNKVLVIGDGVYPRTGLLLTLMNKLDIVHSIDPKMRIQESIEFLNKNQIMRLDGFQNTFSEYLNRENYLFTGLDKADNLCLVLPHSHVTKEELKYGIDVLRTKVNLLSIINMPCCEKNLYPNKGNFIRYDIKTPLSTVYYSEDI